MVTLGWHGYNNGSSIVSYRDSTHKKHCLQRHKFAEVPVMIDENHPFRLWPNLVRNQDLKFGKVLFGFHAATEIIWKHQHPPDCKNAKFMISRGWVSGFGSMVHVEMAGLALAMEMGFVYLQSARTQMLWQVRKSSFCSGRNQSTMECFYEPWSSCTLKDALGSAAEDSMEDIAKRFPAIRDDGFLVLPNGTLSMPSILEENARVVILHHTGHVVSASRFVPSVMKPILACSPVAATHEYYWWRAVSAAYYLRPNKPTLEYMATFRTLDLKPAEACVGIHARHGDKGAEMKIVPFSEYMRTADIIYNKGLIALPSKSRKVPIFLGTDDPLVIEEAIFLDSSSERWRVEYTKLLSRFSSSAKLDNKSRKRPRIESLHHDLEYISMLLDLDYFLRCDAWVCTLKSNFCRVIDELRATVGGKAGYSFADLSAETCTSPPCIGAGIKSFDW